MYLWVVNFHIYHLRLTFHLIYTTIRSVKGVVQCLLKNYKLNEHGLNHFFGPLEAKNYGDCLV